MKKRLTRHYSSAVIKTTFHNTAIVIHNYLMRVKYESTKTAKAIPQDIIHHTPTKEVIYRREHLMLHTMKGGKMYQRHPVTAFLLTSDLKHSLQFSFHAARQIHFTAV
jgi:ribosomal protein L25 (general stress protein Ctc)